MKTNHLEKENVPEWLGLVLVVSLRLAKRELMNLPLPLLFRTFFRREKDFDQLMIVPFSLSSTVEMKLNFWADFLESDQLLIIRNSGNSQTSVCRRKCSYPAIGLVSSSVFIKTDLQSRSSSVSSSDSMMIVASFNLFLFSLWLSQRAWFWVKLLCSLTWFRLVPAGFRAISGGSGRFRQVPGGFCVLHTPGIFCKKAANNVRLKPIWSIPSWQNRSQCLKGYVNQNENKSSNTR